jgi:hypothetical protein
MGDLLSSNSASGVVYKTNINNKDVCVKIVNDYVPLHNKKNETDTKILITNEILCNNYYSVASNFE